MAKGFYIKRFPVVRNLTLLSLLGNLCIGYPFTNIILGIIPLNEVLLFTCLALIGGEIGGIIRRYPVLIPILIWSVVYLFIAVPIGLAEYGIFAARDATHLMEVWWLVVILYICERIYFEEFIQKLIFLITVSLVIKILTLSIPGMENLTIPGLQGDIALFSGKSSMFIGIEVIISAFICGLYRPKVLFFLIPLSIVYFMKRAFLIGIISIVGLYTIIMKMQARIVLTIVCAFVGVLVLLSIVSRMEFLDQFTNNGIENLAPERMAMYLYSATGESNGEFESSAEGTGIRLKWFNENIDKAKKSDKVFLFGQGFGMLLTDFHGYNNPVREPHNSYLSVFARTGFIGFILWALFHLSVNIRAFYLLFIHTTRKLSNDNTLKTLLVFFSTMSGMYLFSLVECGFEAPYSCIPFYMYLGIMVYTSKEIALQNKTIIHAAPGT